MSQLTTTQSNGSALAQWNPEQLDLIKSQIAKDCTNAELQLFGQVCQRTGLDPFARQIYAIKRNDGDSKKMSIQVSIDGLRLIADRTGKYGGNVTFWCGADGAWHDVWLSSDLPVAAKTLVYKIGCSEPFVGVARFDSYKQVFKGNLGNMWKKFPELMIGKCSEALALRKAFPQELSGLYASEEMQQAEVEEVIYKLTLPSEWIEKIRNAREKAELSKEDVLDLCFDFFGHRNVPSLSESQAQTLIEAMGGHRSEVLIDVPSEYESPYE